MCKLCIYVCTYVCIIKLCISHTNLHKMGQILPLMIQAQLNHYCNDNYTKVQTNTYTLSYVCYIILRFCRLKFSWIAMGYCGFQIIKIIINLVVYVPSICIRIFVAIMHLINLRALFKIRICFFDQQKARFYIDIKYL